MKNDLGILICKILDLRFRALSDEITACHSSLGGEFGEWIDVVKDAIGCSEERPLQATGYGTGGAGASEARVLDNIESTSPITSAVRWKAKARIVRRIKCRISHIKSPVKNYLGILFDNYLRAQAKNKLSGFSGL